MGPLLSIFWAGNWHKIGSFFCLLLSCIICLFKNQNKTPIFWRQNLLSSFLFIFSQFFSRQKQNSVKSAQKRQQLKINRFRLFELKTTTKISRANYSYYNNSKVKKINSNPTRQNFNLLRKQKTT